MIVENPDINSRFEFLNQLTKMVIWKVTPSLIITGEGGLGKSYSVTEAINQCELFENEWVVIKGYSTARGLYNTLYDNRDKIVVFDDCDSILEDRVALNILKSALDSYEVRTISWQSRISRGDEYPNQFNFTGSVIFISNKKLSTIDGAILSRSLTVDLSMTREEKISRMRNILSKILPEYSIQVKAEALDFLDALDFDHNLNLRSLIMTSKLRATYPHNWKDIAGYMLKS
jgi:hypothetical protein